MQCRKCKKEIPDNSIYCNHCGTKQAVDTRKTLKRANGSGTIIDFGERAKLRYGARVTCGFVDGKQQYRYIGRWRTKTEARTYLDMYVAGQYTPPSDLTLEEIYHEWKQGHYGHISKQLQDNYISAYNKLKPLHTKKFAALRTAHYQAIIDELALSESSKRKIKVLIGLLYKYAIENDICSKNYAQFIKIEAAAKKEKEIFTDTEIEKLWQARPESDSILVLIYTGFRIQEFLSLKKSNIDIEHMLIKGGLKTDAGKNRIVPIHPRIQPIISRLYESATEWLFVRDENTPVTQSYYRKYLYYPLLEKLNIDKKRRTPHDTHLRQILTAFYQI